MAESSCIIFKVACKWVYTSSSDTALTLFIVDADRRIHSLYIYLADDVICACFCLLILLMFLIIVWICTFFCRYVWAFLFFTRICSVGSWTNICYWSTLNKEYIPIFEIPTLLESFLGVLDAEKEIKQAMREWESKTCLKFVPKKSNHRDYVHFINDGIGRYVDISTNQTHSSLYQYRKIHLDFE